MPESSVLRDSLNTAYRYLSYHPHSKVEIRQWLHRLGRAKEAVEKAIAKPGSKI